jgi:hypothetical protein
MITSSAISPSPGYKAIFQGCDNYGTLRGSAGSGGGYIGGIAASASFPAAAIIYCSKNAGTIYEGSNGSYQIGGIIANLAFDGEIMGCINVGRIYGNNSHTVGGICGSIVFGSIGDCLNAGMVMGGYSVVGGIAGNNMYAKIVNCLNVNWVDKGTAYYYGSVVGNNYQGTVDNCYYDHQMSVIGGIKGGDIGGSAEGYCTEKVIGGGHL